MGGERWLDDREQRAWRGLMTMHADLFAYMERQLRVRSGLSMADYEVLALLAEAPPGRLRSFEIGAMLRWEKSRLSQHLTRMEGRGLVSRERCPTDQRGTFVVLTPRGHEAIAAAAGPHVADARALLLDHVTPAQLDAICELADLVHVRVEELEKRPRGQPPTDRVEDRACDQDGGTP